jgi:hypothetical protein
MSENIDAKLNEAEKALRKKHPELFKGKGVNISLDTSNVERIIAEKTKAEMENERLKKQMEGNGSMNKEEFEKQAEFEERMRTFVKQLKAEQEEQKLREASEQDLDIELQGDKSSSAGVLRLTEEQKAKERGYSPKQGYPSYEAMIDALAENDPEKLKQLQEKWQSDIEQHAQRQASGKIQFVWKDNFEPNPDTGKPESAMFRQIRLANEKKRRKALGEK